MTDAVPTAATAGEAGSPPKLIKTEDGSPAAPITDVPAAAAAAGSGQGATGADTPAPDGQQQQQQGGTSLPQRASSHSGGVACGGSDDFVLTAEMENVLVNFLVRMAFLIGEGQDKDPDMQVRFYHVYNYESNLHYTLQCL
jgi:hypothetical protein